MTLFSACLPVKDGVAVHAALLREADRLGAAGDPRSRGGPRHTIETTTPTGHRYRSTAPPARSTTPPPRRFLIPLLFGRPQRTHEPDAA
ncbi:hypothetical protein [Nocardioides panaciterrulae]|uniref:Uncharacterized protein n=1 Tax=Nocardioides panaciterrulae TaxID=661492 RepID=A0A7Y9J950_9ACTN|nr:hypothetical protein [Nocardioides panaciterrulae]NYD40222.1 hypothetical protein [Nocardioides panaciterrulae]